jgi:hypothetical protein
MKILRSPSLPFLVGLFIAGFTLFAGVALGDIVHVLSGNAAKHSVTTFENVSGVEIRIEKDSTDETIHYTTEAGREVTKPADSVIQIEIGGETSFNAAERDFALGDLKRAANDYRKTLKESSKPWIKLRADIRLLAIAARDKDLEAGVSAFVMMAKRDPAAAVRHRPIVAGSPPGQIAPALAIATLAWKGASPDIQSVLSPLLEELHKSKDAAIAPADVKNPDSQSAKPAVIAQAGTLEAAQRALEARDYARVLKLLEALKPKLMSDPDRGMALFFAAEAEFGQAAGKATPVELRAIIEKYIAVVRQFSGSDAENFPRCTELNGKPIVALANLKMGEILELLEQPEAANLVYQHVVENYSDPIKSAAAAALARPKPGARELAPTIPPARATDQHRTSDQAGTIDLLPLIDLQKDIVKGKWTLDKDGLAFDGTGSLGCVRICYEPPPEYDFVADFTIRRVVSWGDVALICWRAGDFFCANTGCNSNHECWIGSTGDPNAFKANEAGGIYQPDHRYAMRVEVRKDYVAAYIDNKRVARCLTAAGHVGFDGQWYVGNNLLGLGGYDSILFHSVKLVELGQHGRTVSGATLGELPTLARPAPNNAALRTVDLMPLIDWQKDVIEGRFVQPPGGGKQFAVGRTRVRIPYQPPEEYDFRITFHRLSGDNTIDQMAPIAGHTVTWIMGAWSNTVSAFEVLNGQGAFANATTIRAANSFQVGRQYTSTVHVRRDSISASIDGKLVAEYKTDGRDVGSYGWWFVGENTLGIGSETPTIFDAIEIREIRGQGRVVAHPEIPDLGRPAPNDPPKKVVDLMPLIDAQRDAVDGTWRKVERLGLMSAVKGDSRLRIPYQPPQEYDLHVRGHRILGCDCVGLLLSHGGHNFLWVMGGWGNRICGFERIAGRQAITNATTIRCDAVFQNNIPFDVIVHVRNGYVAASMNGKLVAEYKTDYSELSTTPDNLVGDSVVGLKTWGTYVALDVIEIKEITGEGQPSPKGQ